ncbi:MAG: addiction module antidote protein, HigA family [Deltaproteobacteria bacterium RIFOXYD12_FULL_57_12]|nr:MAG: addiction module antidote protein, HigA family [Deltaproteobacteria bacterium RIFOXYD12_FULL_57_12]
MLKLRITTRGNIMKPIHPGRILKREMAARELSANKLALALRVPSGRITQLINGKRGITAETALRLSRYFDNSARFWMNLQTRYELAIAEQAIGQKVTAEVEQAA